MSFAYPGNPDDVFTDVSMEIDTDWKCALIGRNGRGKTTLLNILNGSLEYTGRIVSSVEFDVFPPSCVPNGVNALEVALNCVAYDDTDVNVEALLRAECGKLGMKLETLEQTYDTLSGGERTKLHIAALFLRKKLLYDMFLLIDEPTNHLDADGIESLINYLSRQKGFLLVTHDRNLIDSVCGHIVSINKETIDVIQGNYSAWREMRERDELEQTRKNERLTKDIARLNEAAKRNAEWSDKIEASKIGTHSFDRGFVGKNAKLMMQKSKAIETRIQGQIEEKEGLLQDIDVNSPLLITPLAHPKNRLIEMIDATVNYGKGDLFRPITEGIYRKERIALTGENGTGKSSLLKLIIGEDIPHTGNIIIASNMIISYVPQETAGIHGTPKEYGQNAGVDLTRYMTILRKFGFPREQLFKPLEQSSEGQKKKALLAMSLASSAHLYIWDEPLNYIDILSREQIEDVILLCEPTMIFVDHDRRFAETVSTREIRLMKN
jgi:lincosamide and streptogramin A transport system ATP-binding/permease protein